MMNGLEQTAMAAALREVGTGHVKIVPDIQVGGENGGVPGGLGALLMRSLADGGSSDADDDVDLDFEPTGAKRNSSSDQPPPASLPEPAA